MPTLETELAWEFKLFQDESGVMNKGWAMGEDLFLSLGYKKVLSIGLYLSAYFADSLLCWQDAVTVVGYPLGGDTISVTKGVVSRIEVCYPL